MRQRIAFGLLLLATGCVPSSVVGASLAFASVGAGAPVTCEPFGRRSSKCLGDQPSPADVPMNDEQRAELDRRLDDLEEEGPVGIPWQEVVHRIKGGKA